MTKPRSQRSRHHVRNRALHAISAAMILAGAPLSVNAQSASARSMAAGERGSTQSLLHADRALADTSARRGWGAAIRYAATDDAVALIHGAPVAVGTQAIQRILVARPRLVATRLSWQPLHAEMTSDSSLGVTYGVTVFASGEDTTLSNGQPPAFGRYITVWRHSPTGWRVTATALLGFDPGPPLAGRSDPAAVIPNATEMATRVADADRQFAAKAAHEGVAGAFEYFAAPDAVTFTSNGEFAWGPTAIARSLASGSLASAAWVWHPVVARSSASGELGFTVGEATIQRLPVNGVTPEPFRSKYLTVWREVANHEYRFLVDGGNGLPPTR